MAGIPREVKKEDADAYALDMWYALRHNSIPKKFEKIVYNVGGDLRHQDNWIDQPRELHQWLYRQFMKRTDIPSKTHKESIESTLDGLDNLIEKGEHPHDSDYKDTGDTEQEILDWIDKEKESEAIGDKGKEIVNFNGKKITVNTWKDTDGAGNGEYTYARMPDGSLRNLDVQLREEDPNEDNLIPKTDSVEATDDDDYWKFDGTAKRKCPECDGKGYTKAYKANKLWQASGSPKREEYDEYNVTCSRCNGSGKIGSESIESTLNGLDNLIEADADVKKKEYDWTVDPDLFDEEEESYATASGTSKGAKKAAQTRASNRGDKIEKAGGKMMQKVDKLKAQRDNIKPKDMSEDGMLDYHKKVTRIDSAIKRHERKWGKSLGFKESVESTLHGLDNLIEENLQSALAQHDQGSHATRHQIYQAVDKLNDSKKNPRQRNALVHSALESRHEVLQSASGSLSPQRRNKAIRALQSIPRDQTLGKSDVLPNIDTALEKLDDLIELKQQIGEALVQIEEALTPPVNPTTNPQNRSGYNKFGRQGFRKEWADTIKVYEDFLLKCQQKTGMGATIGTRPAMINSEKDFKDRLRFLEIELRKCQQRM